MVDKSIDIKAGEKHNEMGDKCIEAGDKYIKAGDRHTIEITGMTHEGQGVGKISGFTVFVDGAIIGEKVEVKIINVKKSYAIGKLVGILEASPERAVPFCPSYGKCGGCSLQHMNYKAQLEFKTSMVRESIRRIGKLEDVVIHEAIGMWAPLNYRNKAQYPVGMDKGTGAKRGRALIGFYSGRTHDIVDNNVCAIQHEASDGVRAIVREFIAKNKISVYDETSGSGLVRHIMARVGFKTGEIMVVIVINGHDLPFRQELIDRLTAMVPDSMSFIGFINSMKEPRFHIRSIYLNVNTKRTNVILGDTNIKIFGADTITDHIGKYRFNISPLSFFQVNPVQTEILYGKVLEYANLTGKETVFDLYCGTGTISLFLSEKAKKVYGIEVVEDAVVDARKNAELNGIRNVEFVTGGAEKVMPDFYKRGICADVVILDPPRKGCDAALLDTLAGMQQPERIVYVSCNPATLARDMLYLTENGYRVAEVQPVDMFPHTAHVECVVLMSRVNLG